MTGLLAALQRQPVRAYLYGLLGPGEAVAVSYGLLSENTGALWLALGAAILVVPAAELARTKVTPTAAPRDDAGRPLRALATGGPVTPPPGGYIVGEPGPPPTSWPDQP